MRHKPTIEVTRLNSVVVHDPDLTVFVVHFKETNYRNYRIYVQRNPLTEPTYETKPPYQPLHPLPFTILILYWSYLEEITKKCKDNLNLYTWLNICSLGFLIPSSPVNSQSSSSLYEEEISSLTLTVTIRIEPIILYPLPNNKKYRKNKRNL